MAFLVPVSFLYGGLVRLRRVLFSIGMARSRKLPVRVISVGNLTLGGTGKTPVVIDIAGMFLKHHGCPVVLSRGYGRNNESEIIIVSDGSTVLVDSRSGGDEPVLIATKLSTVPVVAGSDRCRAGLLALRKFNPNIVILDDGFQHLRLRRDIDIVLIDAADPFGKQERLFPAGILREPVSALKRADIVLITRADHAVDLTGLTARIRKHCTAPIFTSKMVPADLIDIRSNDLKPLSALRGTAVAAFSGIARPASFLGMLRSLGAEIRSEIVFPDHHEYQKTDLAHIFQQAADSRVSMIVTTEKDAIRLKTAPNEGVWALRLELQIVEHDAWEKLLTAGG